MRAEVLVSRRHPACGHGRLASAGRDLPPRSTAPATRGPDSKSCHPLNSVRLRIAFMELCTSFVRPTCGGSRPASLLPFHSHRSTGPGERWDELWLWHSSLSRRRRLLCGSLSSSRSGPEGRRDTVRLRNGKWCCALCGAQLAIPLDAGPYIVFVTRAGYRTILLDDAEVHRCATETDADRTAPAS